MTVEKECFKITRIYSEEYMTVEKECSKIIRIYSEEYMTVEKNVSLRIFQLNIHFSRVPTPPWK